MARRCVSGLIGSLLAAVLLAVPTLAVPATAAPDAATPSAAPVRLAVLAADGGAATAALADLLTVHLAQTPGVETVERAELDRVLREQALTAAGLADGVQGRVAVGRLLRADGFLFLARTASQRQFASRLVEARRGCQVMQMFYPTNEAPAAIAERLAGAVSAKLPTLRLADEQRILLNVIRLGNATLDPRAGWIETDGVTMLSGYLAAHPAVLVVERREMGTLLKESQLADAEAPAFRAADFLIDGDVFPAEDPVDRTGERLVVLALRLRDMHLAEQVRAQATGTVSRLETMLAEAAAGIQSQLATLRHGSVTLNPIESRYLLDYARARANLQWPLEASVALDATNTAARQALVKRLRINGINPLGPPNARAEEARKGFIDNARYLAQAAELIRSHPDLQTRSRMCHFPMPPVMDHLQLNRRCRPLDMNRDSELQELLQPVRALARAELERFYLPHREWYPMLSSQLHLFFDDLTGTISFLQSFLMRMLCDTKRSVVDRQAYAAAILSSSMLPPRLFDELGRHADPVIRFFAHVQAARISSTAEERDRSFSEGALLLPVVLRQSQLGSCLAEWHSRYVSANDRNFLGKAIVDIHHSSPEHAARVRGGLLSVFGTWIRDGDLLSLCDTWADQYFVLLDPREANHLHEQISGRRQQPDMRLPRSRHGLEALARLDAAWRTIERKRQTEYVPQAGDKLVMLSHASKQLQQFGYPVRGYNFAVTPQRLLVDGDTLWVAVGGHDINSRKLVKREVAGLMQMDLGSGNIRSLHLEEQVLTLPEVHNIYWAQDYHRFKPLFIWNAYVGVVRHDRGIYLFPRDPSEGRHGMEGVRILDEDDGLPSLDFIGAAALGETLFIALPRTLLAWREGEARVKVLAVTDTEAATGPLASYGQIIGIAASQETGHLYVFFRKSIWRFTPEVAEWKLLADDDDRVGGGASSMHGMMATVPGLVLFTEDRPRGTGVGLMPAEGYTRVRGCFDLTTDELGSPPAAATTPEDHLIRYDLAPYRGGTIVIGGHFHAPGRAANWELAYLVGNMPINPAGLAWLIPSARPPASTALQPAAPPSSSEPPTLISAASTGKLAELVKLLDGGADIDAPDQLGVSPLGHAAVCGHAELLKTLLARGARVDAPDQKGRTALTLAARAGQLRCVNLLLAAGADCRHRDARGYPVLQAAYLSGTPGVVRAVIEAGADPLEQFAGDLIAADFPSSREAQAMFWLATVPGMLERRRITGAAETYTE